ncbi:MAG: GEVED domain-containing protein, partial [Fusobacteriaceae bacterium]
MRLKYKSWLRNIILIITLFLTGVVSAAAPPEPAAPPEEEVVVGEFDFGDAPDSGVPGLGSGSGSTKVNYRYSTITATPARHIVIAGGPKFGNLVDTESIADRKKQLLTNIYTADADDNNPLTPDDEDGIVSVNGIEYENGPLYLLQGESKDGTSQFNTFKVQVTGSGNAKVKIWLDGKDGNINGNFDNAASEIIYEQIINLNTTKEIDVNFNLKGLGNRDATLGLAYLRMRIVSIGDSNSINSPNGLANDGEVEDYAVVIQERKLDYGDLPQEFKTTSLNTDSVNQGGARHLDIFAPNIKTSQVNTISQVNAMYKIGSNKDYEENGKPNSTATGDDDDLIPDDEDGVLFNKNDGGVFYSDNTYTNSLEVTTNRADGWVSVWVDYDGNGSFDNDTPIYTQISALTTSINLPLNKFTAATNPNYKDKRAVRVRYAQEKVESYFGLIIGGEVEDYFVNLTTKPNIDLSKTVTSILRGGVESSISEASPLVLPGDIVTYTISLVNT